MRNSTAWLMIAVCTSPLVAAISEEALRLRNGGLAELENERPARAEALFRQLVPLTPDDPLPYANLAIATLRQQKFDDAEKWIEQALTRAPKDPEVEAIKGEILQWSSRSEEALEVYRRAAAAAPESAELQYALWRQASILSGPEVEAIKKEALSRLRELRPENVVILLRSGQQQLAEGDRTGATQTFLRIKEVLWQAPPAASTLLEQILQALEANDLASVRVPALRLENVLKIAPMYREGLRELAPGIQGRPLFRFRDEPPATSFGESVAVKFAAKPISTTATTGRDIATGDFDGDQRPDWARLIAADGGSLEVWLAANSAQPAGRFPAPGLERLLAADLDNDGHLDLIAYGADSTEVFRGVGDGSFTAAGTDFGLSDTGAHAVAVLDFDIEGDLDVATAGGRNGTAELFRNSLAGPLEPVGKLSLPELSFRDATDLIASDLDRDGDVDLLIAHGAGLTLLDNLRQGLFVDRSQSAGLAKSAPVQAVISVDLDQDGYPDLVTAGRGLSLLHNRQGRFESWEIGRQLRTNAEFSSVVAFDADNDGRMDLAMAGAAGLVVASRQSTGGFEFLEVVNPPSGVVGLAAVDLDQDCDLDLLAGGSGGLYRLDNSGGNQNHCFTVRLQGLDTGNSKNNHFGLGATLEVRSGQAYQFQEVDSDVTHFGLGQLPKADLLRVVWSNGVPQNRLQVQTDQRIVEEQVLKGSCPFLYAWDGERVSFVTDLLWGAPVGLPVRPGVWASTDPQELVMVPNLVARGGSYELKITEELWEAAFFDYLRLWVVDHPVDIEVASSLRIVPGEIIDDRVLGTRRLRPLTAWDDRAHDLSERVAKRDEVYASAWQTSPYQGVAAQPWSLVLDLGEAPAKPLRLHLDGWIFPTDASLNLAIAQRQDLETWPPRLEVETTDGWQVLLPSMGFPAGKTKTMVIDTPTLPVGARKLRIVGTQWLSFDRIAWSTETADDELVVQARLAPTTADLHFRGFSRMYRTAPNGPHYFDYSRLQTESPWLPFPGRYTRYGDVRELLGEADDRSVILASGDEIAVRFDAASLPPPTAGWQRSYFLESHGWDKDADRNTGAGQHVEPLPFRAMSTYPYGDGEVFPDTDLHRDYLRNWLTRLVEPEPGMLTSTIPSP